MRAVLGHRSSIVLAAVLLAARISSAADHSSALKAHRDLAAVYAEKAARKMRAAKLAADAARRQSQGDGDDPKAAADAVRYTRVARVYQLLAKAEQLRGLRSKKARQAAAKTANQLEGQAIALAEEHQIWTEDRPPTKVFVKSDVAIYAPMHALHNPVSIHRFVRLYLTCRTDLPSAFDAGTLAEVTQKALDAEVFFKLQLGLVPVAMLQVEVPVGNRMTRWLASKMEPVARRARERRAEDGRQLLGQRPANVDPLSWVFMVLTGNRKGDPSRHASRARHFARKAQRKARAAARARAALADKRGNRADRAAYQRDYAYYANGATIFENLALAEKTLAAAFTPPAQREQQWRKMSRADLIREASRLQVRTAEQAVQLGIWKEDGGAQFKVWLKSDVPFFALPLFRLFATKKIDVVQLFSSPDGFRALVHALRSPFYLKARLGVDPWGHAQYERPTHPMGLENMAKALDRNARVGVSSAKRTVSSGIDGAKRRVTSTLAAIGAGMTAKTDAVRDLTRRPLSAVLTRRRPKPQKAGELSIQPRLSRQPLVRASGKPGRQQARPKTEATGASSHPRR